MNKGFSMALVVILLIVVMVIVAISSYNGLVVKREEVDTQYANLDTVLQRRADLIPNLVNTVKGFVSHEENIIKEITDARAKLTNSSNVSEQAEANAELTEKINALMVVVENYPDLKASTNFTQLSDELAGTENRISTARMDYNNAVKEYNTSIKKFPTSTFANMFGFEAATYFEATEKGREVPVVDFGE